VAPVLPLDKSTWFFPVNGLGADLSNQPPRFDTDLAMPMIIGPKGGIPAGVLTVASGGRILASC
jgi:hypothetical protein